MPFIHRDDEPHRYTGGLEKPYEPQDIDDATRAFPANVRHLYPDGADIPDDYMYRGSGSNPWVRLIMTMFYHGLPAGTQFHPKKGIDAEKAYRHIHAMMRTFETPHEFKMAACAYLLDEWFEDVTVEGVSKLKEAV